ncbi:MAG: hypothetical protein AB3N13_08720 [Arenibacterium sp.]
MKIVLFQGSKLAWAAAALSVLLPATAVAWKADNRLDVHPLPSSDAFEVIGRPGSGGSDYWCAAGDYALRQLGASATARIYITRTRGTPETSNRLESVQFSLSPVDGQTTRTPPFLSMRRVGDNLSVTFARNYCLDLKNLEF